MGLAARSDGLVTPAAAARGVGRALAGFGNRNSSRGGRKRSPNPRDLCLVRLRFRAVCNYPQAFSIGDALHGR